MRAARLHEIGGVPTVDEIDPPSEPGLLEVDAAALNPVDIAIGNGRFYGGVPEVPYVIGSEAVARDPDGRRLWIRGRALMAELVGPSVEWRFEVPDGVGDELALACGIAGLTGWLAVSWRAPVTRDDTVLVLGASGTLGSTALQGAKLLGARRVIGAARRTDAVPSVADEVVDLSAGGELPSASVIVDALWGEPFLRALAAAPTGARIVQLGQSAGPEVAAPVRLGARQDRQHPRLHALRDAAGRRRERLPGALRARTRRPDRSRHRALSARGGRRGLGAPGLGKPRREDRRHPLRRPPPSTGTFAAWSGVGLRVVQATTPVTSRTTSGESELRVAARTGDPTPAVRAGQIGSGPGCFRVGRED